jgi:hypothetical protein
LGQDTSSISAAVDHDAVGANPAGKVPDLVAGMVEDAGQIECTVMAPR